MSRGFQPCAVDSTVHRCGVNEKHPPCSFVFHPPWISCTFAAVTGSVDHRKVPSVSYLAIAFFSFAFIFFFTKWQSAMPGDCVIG